MVRPKAASINRLARRLVQGLADIGQAWAAAPYSTRMKATRSFFSSAVSFSKGVR